MDPKEKRANLAAAYNTAVEAIEARKGELDGLADDVDDDTYETARTALTDAITGADRAKEKLDTHDAHERAVAQHVKIVDNDATDKVAVRVNEPDMYTKERQTFLRDLYAAQLKHDFAAMERIQRHQQHELTLHYETNPHLRDNPESRAIATGTLGGVIPPNYLVSMYAKAPRAGRVFADQVNQQELPEYGMSCIIPRLTQGTDADVQATESTAVTTQDVTEIDLVVPIRTIAGYIPVSRQTLERAAYSEPILMEDLVARYWSRLDKQCLVGLGSGGEILGLLETDDTNTVTAPGGTIIDVWPKLAQALSEINTRMGGIGYGASKIVMHPRRWGAFTAYFDKDHRPLFGYNGSPSLNVAADGVANTYGYVGNLQGLPVFTDANVPTDLGESEDEDVIIVIADPVVHLWERNGDPVTLAFEQQAGTSLQVQLIVYGYAAFTAGRYPGAVSLVEGLPHPSFGPSPS